MPLIGLERFGLKKIDIDDVMNAAQRHIIDLDNPGFCLACGEENDCCEPDMEDGRCEYCEENAVYGAEGLLILMA